MKIIYFGPTEIPDQTDPIPNLTQLQSGSILKIF